MKRSISLIIGMLLAGLLVVAQPDSVGRHLRDSIFETYRSMTETSDKVNYMRSMYFANVDKKWALELLDSILALSQIGKDTNVELVIQADYYWHYKFMSDLPQMERCLSELRTVSFKYKSYEYYFRIWNDMLQFYNVRGDTEYVRIQSLKMEEEARMFNDSVGIAYAYMSMARSLAASKNDEEAVTMFRKVLKMNAIKPMTRALVHSEIVTIFQESGKNEEAIKELLMQQAVLSQIIAENPSRAPLYNENLLELELLFCAVYDNMNDALNLLKHLKKADNYYTSDSFFPNYIGYHAYWGAYYRLTRQWESCFREFDIALAHFDDTQPLYEIKILRMKGNALAEAGRYEEAALLYKDIAFMGDSLNNDVMRLHQEALQANYNIRKALLEKETLEKQYGWMIVALVMLTGVIVLMMVLRTLKGRRALLRAEKETREALEIVATTNKMKEVFLHNITHQIRGPLNVVVGFSEILANEKDLTPEMVKEFSVSIKKNAGLLFQLIIDVLDLSRLESGMMKFTVSECDAVQMCRDAKMSIEMQEQNMTRLSFETDLDAVNIHTDSGRFLKMLLSVLSAPQDYERVMEVKYTLTCESNQLKIVVENSPLLELSDDLQHIKHDINRLYLEVFKGTYQYPAGQKEGGVIIITYPLN